MQNFTTLVDVVVRARRSAFDGLARQSAIGASFSARCLSEVETCSLHFDVWERCVAERPKRILGQCQATNRFPLGCRLPLPARVPSGILFVDVVKTLVAQFDLASPQNPEPCQN